MPRWAKKQSLGDASKKVIFQEGVKAMNSVSRATLVTEVASVTAVASEIDSDFPLAPESGQKKLLASAWFDAPGPQDGKTQKLLDRLEAENTKLRARVVELVLEIRSLRDGDVQWRGCA